MPIPTPALTGDVPRGKVVFDLPVFIDNILSADVGIVSSSSGEVSLEPETRSVTVRLVATPGGAGSSSP